MWTHKITQVPLQNMEVLVTLLLMSILSDQSRLKPGIKLIADVFYYIVFFFII